MNRTIKRLVLPLGAAVILGTSGFAYMATNTVATSYVGNGQGTISGYVANSQQYNTTYTAGGHEVIESVTFTLNHPANASNVHAYITDKFGGVQYYSTCTSMNGANTVFDCVADNQGNISHSDTAASLNVIAAQ